MKNQLGKSKWVTGLLVTLVMTMFMALPVMAKEYTFSFENPNYTEAVPSVLNSGDRISCSESSCKVMFYYEDKNGNSIGERKQESELTNSEVVETVDGISEWSVVARQDAYHQGNNEAFVFFVLQPKNNFESEEQNVELPDGQKGKEYSAAWVDFGDDSNIVCETFVWNGYFNGSGLDFGFDSDHLPLNVEGNKIYLSGTPKKAGLFTLPVSIEVWYRSDKYPNGHKIICNFAKTMTILDEDGNEKYGLSWNNECKLGTVDKYYDTAYWVFYKLDKYPGYKSTSCRILKVLDLPDGVDVITGADPRNDGMMGLRFKGTPTTAGTWHPVVYGNVTYSNDEGSERDLSFKWRFTIKIEGDDDDDDDDDDDNDSNESAPSNNSSSNSTWTAPSSELSQSQTPAQAQATQISAVQTAVASVPTLLATNSAVYSRTGMPLDMTSVNTLDANTVNLLSTNNKIPYNVTITFAGNPFTVKIPAGFNYKSFVKADGSVNIHEVLWAILSGQKR